MKLNCLKLEIARAKKQLSILELAKKAHCGLRYFGKTDEEFVEVPTLTAGRIAAALDVNLEWLITDYSKGIW